jgi:hypothetical protein
MKSIISLLAAVAMAGCISSGVWAKERGGNKGSSSVTSTRPSAGFSASSSFSRDASKPAKKSYIQKKWSDTSAPISNNLK